VLPLKGEPAPRICVKNGGPMNVRSFVTGSIEEVLKPTCPSPPMRVCLRRL
jgi:hypothetical protein